MCTNKIVPIHRNKRNLFQIKKIPGHFQYHDILVNQEEVTTYPNKATHHTRYIKAIFSSCFIPCSNGVLYLNVSTIKLTYLFQMISLGSHLPSDVHSCLYLSPENDQSRLMSTCLDSSHCDAFLLTSFSFFMGQLVT